MRGVVLVVKDERGREGELGRASSKLGALFSLNGGEHSKRREEEGLMGERGERRDFGRGENANACARRPHSQKRGAEISERGCGSGFRRVRGVRGGGGGWKGIVWVVIKG